MSKVAAVVRLIVFQSSPSPKAGCNTIGVGNTVGDVVFQSSPSPKAGCNS